MKNGYGQEVRWVLEEDLLAYAKEKWPPEMYAQLEARHKELHERRKARPRLRPSRIRKGELLIRSRQSAI